MQLDIKLGACEIHHGIGNLIVLHSVYYSASLIW